MATATKKLKAAETLYDREKSYSVEEALGILKKLPSAKFDETVDMSLRLGVDPKHADQMVRGAIGLPHGIGKAGRGAGFAQGGKGREAAGADGGDRAGKAVRRQGTVPALGDGVLHHGARHPPGRPAGGKPVQEGPIGSAACPLKRRCRASRASGRAWGPPRPRSSPSTADSRFASSRTCASS